MQFAAAREARGEHRTRDVSVQDRKGGVWSEDRRTPVSDCHRGRVAEIEERVRLQRIPIVTVRLAEVARDIDDVGRDARAGEGDVGPEVRLQLLSGNVENDDSGVRACVEIAVGDRRAGRRLQARKLLGERGQRGRNW